jgi:phenylacetate-coenzyme A ligase PaaK-like adenylate-forming protein
MTKTPLEDWIARKIGLAPGTLTREALREYQFRRIRKTVAMAMDKSSFYRSKLAGFDPALIDSEAALARLPFTEPRQLREDPLRFVCSGLGSIERIVTLQSSGTTGSPKRIFFTKEDQELTIDFFDYGMRNLVRPGDRVLILLPCATPGSVGDLLRIGLERMGAVPLPYGPVHDPADAVNRALLDRASAAVGIPTHLLAMARQQNGARLKGQIKNVLLSTDYVPEAISRVLEERWGCRVYNHYGTTEMGLGGGVQCSARRGYHFREADLFIEIVDPHSGEPVPEGTAGEIVFTTLTRTGMPLIRYRTGDLSRLLPGRCPCGTVLRSMEPVKYRLSELIRIGELRLSMPDLDEKLFPLPGVLDYRAEMQWAGERAVLHIDLKTVQPENVDCEMARQALLTLPALQELYPEKLQLEISCNSGNFTVARGTAKRRIVQRGAPAKNH